MCGRQVVEIKHTLKEPRALTDPVGTAGHTMELRLRDACWRQANGEFQNRLPLQSSQSLASLSIIDWSAFKEMFQSTFREFGAAK